MTIVSGRLITLEGVDGSGKTTQLTLLREYLIRRGISVVTTREPGGTAFGEELRHILLQGEFECSPETEMLTLFAARSHNLSTVIRPAIEAGQWVLCDRFTDATFAYQGGGGKLRFEAIQKMEMLIHPDIQPDLTILLDLPVKTGLARTLKRGGNPDYFEQQNLSFKERVRETYLLRQTNNPNRIRLIDASRSINEIHEAIREQLEALFDNDDVRP